MMESYRARDWEIMIFHGSYLKTDELASLGSRLGLKVPDIVTHNIISLRNTTSDVLYEITPENALKMCSDTYRSEKLYTQGENDNDFINIIPENVKVLQSVH